MCERLVEVNYQMLSFDVALVFHLVDNSGYFCVVLAVAGVLFMPLNCLYCENFVFSG